MPLVVSLLEQEQELELRAEAEARRSGYDIELTTQKTKVNGVAAGLDDDACEGVQGKKP